MRHALCVSRGVSAAGAGPPDTPQGPGASAADQTGMPVWPLSASTVTPVYLFAANFTRKPVIFLG